MGLRFLFNKFSIKYDEAALKILYKNGTKSFIQVSSILKKRNLPLLSDEYNTIVSLLVRTVFTLLGWKGKKFIDQGSMLPSQLHSKCWPSVTINRKL